jgi:hypothetical protein
MNLRAHLYFLALALLLATTPAYAICFGQPKQVYVGDTSSDGDCTYNDIQTALDNEGGTCPAVVNITREHTYTNQALTISGKSLTLKGWGDGVTCNLLKNCTAVGCLPAETGAPLITLSGEDGNSVLHIDGASGVSLTDLTLTGGILTPAQDGGGIYFGGSGSLSLQNTTVEYNQAGYGAGIAMSPSGTATLTLGPNTVIQYNDATVNGGGILIEGQTTLTATSPNTYINGNTALSGSGGGLIVNGFAIANIGSSGYFGLPVISGNTAQYGGGIAAFAQSGVSPGVNLFTTDANNPVQVSGNVASATGGAVYLKPYVPTGFSFEAAPFFCADNFRLDDNISQEGSAIYADEDHDVNGDYLGSNVRLNDCAPAGAVACAAGVTCNEMSGNVAENTNQQPTDGAVILMQSSGFLQADRIKVSGNQGGAAIRVLTDQENNWSGGNGNLAVNTQLENCLLADNVLSGELFDATPGGGDNNKIVLDGCTIVGNQIGAPYLMLVQLSDTSSFAVRNSLIAQPGRATVDYDGSFDNFAAKYIVSNDITTLSSVGVGVRTGTPSFVDATNGDYHLQRTSIGVNYAPAGTTSHDLDGNARVVNLPDVPDVYGPMDVGAYEIQSSCAVADTIFCDGFDGQ